MCKQFSGQTPPPPPQNWLPKYLLNIRWCSMPRSGRWHRGSEDPFTDHIMLEGVCPIWSSCLLIHAALRPFFPPFREFGSLYPSRRDFEYFFSRIKRHAVVCHVFIHRWFSGNQVVDASSRCEWELSLRASAVMTAESFFPSPRHDTSVVSPHSRMTTPQIFFPAVLFHKVYYVLYFPNPDINDLSWKRWSKVKSWGVNTLHSLMRKNTSLLPERHLKI